MGIPPRPPVSPRMTNFNTLMGPSSMPLPSSFGAGAFTTDIDLPAGQPIWLQTIALGNTTAEFYSGETVYYILEHSAADRSASVVFGGIGTFTATMTVQRGTTNFNYQISGAISCLTINKSVKAACTAWQTIFTANLS